MDMALSIHRIKLKKEKTKLIRNISKYIMEIGSATKDPTSKTKNVVLVRQRFVKGSGEVHLEMVNQMDKVFIFLPKENSLEENGKMENMFNSDF